jgi:hypothetical protein
MESNQRRWELLKKKHDHGPLSPVEVAELSQLQDAMVRFRQRVAPLPLEDSWQLYDELLQKALSKSKPPNTMGHASLRVAAKQWKAAPPFLPLEIAPSLADDADFADNTSE